MAYEEESPFAPGPQGFNVIPNPTPEQQGDLATRWRGFLADPESRASLMQFGLQLSQPVALGQNTLGHIGQAVGAGGEAATRVRAEDRLEAESARKERDTDSRAELRSAQADSAGARAGTAEARANTAAVRAAAENDRLSNTRESNTNRALIQAQGLFQKEVADVRKRNENSSLMGGAAEVVPTFDEWLTRNPLLRQQLGNIAPAMTVPETNPQSSQAPSNPSDRQVGTTYQTPKGPLVWMGDGKWRMP